MRRFPIYSFVAKWTENDPEGGRRSNSSGYRDVMFREPPVAEELHAMCIERQARLIRQDPSRTDFVVSFDYSHHEEWCLTWFSHYTFDDGQTDDEAMASFASFVDRTRQFNRENQQHTDSGHSCDPRCLMGAEDMWRWGGDTGAPPCRCKHCKKAGVLRVDH